MKKGILLLYLLATTVAVVNAQKIIIVNDSTAQKSYFSNRIAGATTIYEVSATGKTTVTQVPAKDGIKYTIADQNIIKTNGDLFLKDLKFNLFNSLLAANSASLTLNYIVYFNAENKPDSIVSTLSQAKINEANGRVRYNFYDLSDDERSNYEKAVKSALQNYKNFANLDKPYQIKGYITFKQSPANIASFFASKSDTITKISLEGFGLTEFPLDQLQRFKKLKEINLKDNYLTDITVSKLDFPYLKTLSLQNNKFRDNSTLSFKDGLELKSLNLNNNYFTHIPANLKGVKDLFLANNMLYQFTKKDIKATKGLTTLNLYANQISTISPKIKRLKKLKELDLYRNNLTSLPKQITKLKKLEALAISYNQLDILPEKIGKMKGLKTLYTHHNQLKNLPKLPAQLEILDVGYNKIEEVAVNVSPLKGLKTLDYSNNKVTGDLDFLLQLPNIKEVYLFENNYAANEQEERYFGKVFTELVTKGVTVK